MAADGTQIDTFTDNLLAEASIGYGGTGGIAYHYASGTYIALLSKFIPCGVWHERACQAPSGRPSGRVAAGG